mgnify:FL=1
MTIEELINQLQYEIENKARLHELAWELVNLTRPEQTQK